MFESFYGLTANPFRMSADEQFRFMHKAYKKAWAYLNYALDKGEGFVLITGRPGTGKTTLIRDTLAELDSERVKPVSVVCNQLQDEELLRLVALGLGLQAQEFDKATLLTRIEQHALMLYQQQCRVVVLVDEAQSLSLNGLEMLRMLSNLQTGNQPLFQIVLIGQEELRHLIYGQAMENITQRIVASCNLEPMTSDYVQGYVEHRLGMVGWTGDPAFSSAIYEPLYRISRGVPRDINLIMARLLLYGALEEKHRLERDDLITVLTELSAEQRLNRDQMALIGALSEAVAPETLEQVAQVESVKLESAGQAQVNEWEAMPVPETPAREDAEGGHSAPSTAEQVTPVPAALPPEQEQEQEQTASLAQSADPLSEPSVQDLQAFEDDLTVAEQEAWEDTEPAAEEEVEVPTLFNVVERESIESGTPVVIDELPKMPVYTEAEQRRPQGLYSDMDELIGHQGLEESTDGKVWRWFFYPLAIGLLVIAVLAVRYPDEVNRYWQRLQDWGSQTINELHERASSRATQTPPQTDSPPEAESLPVAEPLPEVRVVPLSVDSADALRRTQTTPVAAAALSVPVEIEPRATEVQPQSQSEPDSESESEEILVWQEAVSEQQSTSPRPYVLKIDQDSGRLAAESEALFSQLLHRLQADSHLFVALTGVSVSKAGSLRAMRNALQHAEQVSQLLVQQGIAQERIGIEGRSSSDPRRSATVEVRFRE
jgi:type II secretory pathway predicted ATPase ExeA